MTYTVLLLLVIVLLVVATLRKALNRVVGFGPFYVIRRDNGKKSDPKVTTGFMKEIAAPWRQGKGVQITVSTFVLQVGVCKKHNHPSEEEGVLTAIGGRYLDSTTQEIREW